MALFPWYCSKATGSLKPRFLSRDSIRAWCLCKTNSSEGYCWLRWGAGCSRNAIATEPDPLAALVDACPSTLEVVTLARLAAPFSVGLGVLLFLWPFAGSLWQLWEELSEGDGESLLFDVSETEYPWTLFIWSSRFHRRGKPWFSWARSHPSNLHRKGLAPCPCIPWASLSWRRRQAVEEKWVSEHSFDLQRYGFRCESRCLLNQMISNRTHVDKSQRHLTRNCT